MDHEQTNWEQLLPGAQKAYNTTPPGQGEPSPHELVFGQVLVLTHDTTVQNAEENQDARGKILMRNVVFELCKAELEQKS